MNRAVRALPPDLREKILRGYYYAAFLAPDCTRSSRCVAVCPTGAPRAEAGEEDLGFKSARCCGGALCETFCNGGALAIEPGYRGGDPSVCSRPRVRSEGA